MIERADIEAKARQIQDAIDETKSSILNTAMMAGVAVLVALMVAFLVGRRKGKAGKAIVEVYRLK